MVHSTGGSTSSIIYSEELDPSIIRSSRSTPMEDEVDMTGETTKEESSDSIEEEEKWLSLQKKSYEFISKGIFLISNRDGHKEIEEEVAEIED